MDPDDGAIQDNGLTRPGIAAGSRRSTLRRGFRGVRDDAYADQTLPSHVSGRMALTVHPNEWQPRLQPHHARCPLKEYRRIHRPDNERSARVSEPAHHKNSLKNPVWLSLFQIVRRPWSSARPAGEIVQCNAAPAERGRAGRTRGSSTRTCSMGRFRRCLSALADLLPGSRYPKTQ